MTPRLHDPTTSRLHDFHDIHDSLRSPTVPLVVCVGIGAAWLLPAAYDLGKLLMVAVGQLNGPAYGTDFLNLYAGATLFTQRPEDTYSLAAQHDLQRALTARDSLPVPFYLPPYAAVLVGWLSWLPYGVAYMVWLVIGVACLALAIALIAPRLTGWATPVWFCLAMLYLPVVLGLAQGQTSALSLLACAAVARGFLDDGPNRRTGLGPIAGIASVVGWLLKPQFAPAVLLALIASRRWLVLTGSAAVIGALAAVAVPRLGATGTAQLSAIAQDKLVEALVADPLFLIGPTLLHASHWFLGVNPTAQAVAAVLVGVSLGALLFVWRHGPADGERRLLQLAILPIVAVIAAPYALIYELAPWIVSFWLLWRFTESRKPARAVLLWLVAGTWISANIGVAEPRAGGADLAAVFGLGLVAFIAWQFHTPQRCTPWSEAERGPSE
jgi:hypothetical protein